MTMTEAQLKELGYTFPERLNILLTRDKAGKFSIIFSRFKNKKVDLSNVKYSSTGVWLFDGTSCVSLGVYDFATYDDFYKAIDRFNAAWIRTSVVNPEEGTE